MIVTREDLFRTICNACRLGTLGYFIGAGFSKAVLEGGRYQSYKWDELLVKCCDEFGVDRDVTKSYCSNPELASKICSKVAEKKGISYVEAVRLFKKKVCELTNTYPEDDKREKYSAWFREVRPSWIATTNYDSIIESILGGEALPISPNGCFCNISGLVPVFHLHGVCNEPDDIIITNEDYAYMFRPNDYRQSRLPFLIKESCVLMIGYGLGDFNVITAVDWANNVFTNVNEAYDFPIIQLLFKREDPKPEPYVTNGNVVILEISSIESFFDELCNFMSGYKAFYSRIDNDIQNNINYLSNTTANIKNFIENTDNHRGLLLEFFENLPPEYGYMYNYLFPFVRVAIDALDDSSRYYGHFDDYNKKLIIILDLLKSIPVKKIPASLFGMLASELNKVGEHFNADGKYYLGESYVATDTWMAQRGSIPRETVEELQRFANANKGEYINLVGLLKRIPDETAPVAPATLVVPVAPPAPVTV